VQRNSNIGQESLKSAPRGTDRPSQRIDNEVAGVRKRGGTAVW